MAKSKAELMAEKMQQQQSAKAAFEAGKKPAVEIPTPAPVEETSPVEVVEKPTEQESVVTVDVIQKIAKEKKRPKKSSFSVYLSEENMKKLGAAAKKAGLSKSEFIDHLLSELL